jgi:hypothetical protein
MTTCCMLGLSHAVTMQIGLATASEESHAQDNVETEYDQPPAALARYGTE